MAETEEAGWIAIVPGIRRRTLVAGEHMMQILVKLDAGSHLPEHQHPHEQITYVLQGRLRFVIGGVTREFGPGDTAYMAGGVPHAVDTLEDALVTDTFSPPREDMLEIDRRQA